MARKEEWDRDSLAWIHRIREEHYHQTKSQRLEDWLSARRTREGSARLPALGRQGEAG